MRPGTGLPRARPGRATFALRQTLTFNQRVRGFRDAFAYLAGIGLTTNIETGTFQTTNSPADNVATENNYAYNLPAMAVYAAGQGTVRMRIDWLHQDTDPSLPTLTQRVLNELQFNGKNVLGQQINPGQQATRQEALFHYTNANTWFIGPPAGLGLPDGDLLGVTEVGRHGDVAVLSDDYFAVPDEALKKLYSVLTVVNGKVVHTGQVRYAA